MNSSTAFSGVRRWAANGSRPGPWSWERPLAALLALRGFDNAPGSAAEVLWDHAGLGLPRFERLTPRHVAGRALLTKRPRGEQGADDDGAAGEDADGPPERGVVAVCQRQ